MRWLVWLFTGTTCLAGYGGLLPEIEIGTSGREMVVHGPPRMPEGGMCQTFLVGTVTEVSAEEDRQPQKTRLSESCTLHVDSAYGYLKQLVGSQMAVLKASYEQSPYDPIEEEWGKLWHFKKGQRLLVILHLWEGEPCFDSEELIVLDKRTAALPDILRRTALQPDECTEDDLEVLQQASPFLHRQFLSHIIGDHTTFAELARLRLESLRAVAGFAALVLLGILTIRKVLK
ncbi:MAG: hypothetical protein B7Z37_16465 [Verrucomicrobia bacterium 12-59-8]|nr:MAG: hypothetical protein B7Z37_16465 [Verrucomicrobia bacterium 12-59-8]